MWVMLYDIMSMHAIYLQWLSVYHVGAFSELKEILPRGNGDRLRAMSHERSTC